MESQAMFLNCPAYLDNGGAARCGQPAEAEERYTIDSTDGPLECARIRCPRGHHFNGAIGSLTMHRPPGVAAVSASLPPPLNIVGGLRAANRENGDDRCGSC
jgi:hypothetical protein